MTVTRIVARDDAREFSTSCGNFAPKKVTTLCVTSTGPNLLYKILFLRNRNLMSYCLVWIYEDASWLEHVYGDYMTVNYVWDFQVCMLPPLMLNSSS